ncbi:MAG: ABC transporter ATP-binding protein [Gammaproteobacteria bacterium]|nr:ABC transporter ATP-binding protein [Gammaproteobacteria bacterium]MBV9621552.1 ABC transporter ATP-binding protein [Gammaproteobacteria bacterium]
MIASQLKPLADRPWLDPTAQPQIRIEAVSKSYGTQVAVDAVTLHIYKGEMFALVGASGCGKTTLLRMLAGFAHPTSGRLFIDELELGPVPPHERPVNMMFQSYALFPHMTVADNVGYGLRRLSLPAATKRQRVQEALDMVQLGALGGRKPHQLSGGQRQRVALARALIRRPKVLLLDEPLSALDKKLREQTQFELMDLQYKLGITFIVVTHDQDEAMALATRIAVMNQGQVVQVGTPAEIYEFPRSRFIADFVGTTNLFEGTVCACEPGLIRVQCSETGGELLVDETGVFNVGQRVWVALRPEKVRLAKEPRDGNRINQLRGTVWELGYLGNRSTYRVRTTSGKLVTVFAQNERRTSEATIDWSDEVFVSWSADAAVLLQS